MDRLEKMWLNRKARSLIGKHCGSVLFLPVAALFFSTVISAGQSVTSTIDCSEVSIDYSDDPTLTRAEKIDRMEQAFFESINRFELCNLSNQTNASAQSSQSGGEAAAGAEGGDDGSFADGQSSMASQQMQGTEAPEETATAFPETGSPSANDTLEQGTVISSGSADNGAVPEDIPAANNDDAVAAQIRLAAERETDPEIKKKLWNEYRKYKGLETVDE